jgi:hypothetical protein
MGMRMAGALIAAAWASWAVAPAYAQSVDVPEIEHVERVALPGCDFVAFVPASVARSEVTVQGVTMAAVYSTYDPDDPGPAMRVECFPLANMEMFSHDALRHLLSAKATIAGLHSPEINLKDDDLGMTGTYAGDRLAGAFRAKIFGKIVIGQDSVLHLMVEEPPESFPSPATVYFLNTIDARRPTVQ